LLAAVTGASAGQEAEPSHMRSYTVEGVYEDVRFDLMSAIAERGLVINNISHIGNMLARTGEGLGLGKPVYTRAEAFEFCSAELSRRMMEADPYNIVFCPYIITMFELPGEPGTVHIAFRRPQPVGSEKSRAALAAVEALLDAIARAAIE